MSETKNYHKPGYWKEWYWSKGGRAKRIERYKREKNKLMGTNFYAHIIPIKKRRDALKKLINANDFNAIVREINKTYGEFEVDFGGVPSGGVIHLGKRSAGWKFCWNPNVYVVRNGYFDKELGAWQEQPDTLYYTYPLTKAGIKAFIDREDVEVWNEYGEKQDKEKFWKMALEWTIWTDHKTGEVREAWDAASYEEWELEQNKNYKVYNMDSDLIRALEKEGIKFTSNSHSDFYSDGLRFASYTNFS